ncbi:MAG TPA: PDZ domain-containing protein, partial [Pyrinomonadaceae bacterium]|nr:PDZ domain-containing protein [Pyrinomonadaceae bacterium]
MDKFEMPDAPNAPDMPDLETIPRVQMAPRAPGVPGGPMVWAFGNRRQIGVGLTPLTKQLSSHFGVDGGALINDVREDSPAAKAGLKAGDIIVEADGKAVKGEGDVIRAISEKKEGEVTLTIVRDKNRQTIRVTPEEMKGGFNTFFEFPDAPEAPAAPATPGVFRMTRPMKPGEPAMAPMPMNSFFVPGRIV